MRAAIRERWGEDAVGDRSASARSSFPDPPELEWLEQLLHPRAAPGHLAAAWLATVDRPLAVVEIPLLFETGGEARFDKVVVITAPRRPLRVERRGPFADREARLDPGGGEGAARRLLLCQRQIRSTTSTPSSPAW